MRYHTLPLLLLIIILPACSRMASRIMVNNPDDVQAVKAVLQDYAATLNAGDMHGWANLWLSNGLQMPPGMMPVVGKDKLFERVAAAAKHYTFNMEIDIAEVRVSGKLAYVRGFYTSAITPKSGGADMYIDGKFLTILLKQPDESWKIYRDIFNSNVPPKPVQ